jgi:TolB protein
MAPAGVLLALAAGLAGVALTGVPRGAGQDAPPGGSAGNGDDEEPPLPAERLVITVEAEEASIYRIAIPDLTGLGARGREAGEILRKDFALMPGYRVIGPGRIGEELAGEGLSMAPARWSALDAAGVVKGTITEPSDGLAGALEVTLRFYRVSSAAPALERTWTGLPDQLRPFLHEFGNAILETLTGTPGPFGTKLVFARREAPGKKDVWTTEMDGHGLEQVTRTDGVAMLPSFGPDGRVWFTRLTRRGMFITHQDAPRRRIISGDGLTMSPAICEGRVFFVSSRDGNSEIYSARLDGSDPRRLTRHPALDLSPTCGPGGRLAFVSTRHGSPQIFVMGTDGSGVRRVTYKGNHNQTPAWCPDPQKPLLAFTGRDGNYDVFTVDLGSGEYTRLTQGQGDNKDPAFSPDCRVVAFVSNRRGQEGLYLSSPQGFNQVRVVDGPAETVEWSRR